MSLFGYISLGARKVFRGTPRPETVLLAFDVSTTTAARLDKLAEATKRPRSWLLDQALAAYLDQHAPQLAHPEERVADAGEGNEVSHAAFDAWLKGWGADQKRKPSR